MALRDPLRVADAADVLRPADSPTMGDPRPRGFSPAGSMTILFVDLDDAHEVRERLGEAAWLGVVRTYVEIVRTTVAFHEGLELKAPDDGWLSGFMVAFGSSPAAIRAAVRIQREVAEHEALNPSASFGVRIGVHAANPANGLEDVFGRTARVAASVAVEATGGQILATRAAASAAADPACRGRDLALGAVGGVERVYEIAWR